MSTAELAERVAELVRAQPGVAGVYASTVRRGLPLPAAVSVVERDGRLHVATTIAVQGAPATQVCRAVYKAVSAYLLGQGRPVERVSIRVGSAS